MSEDDGLKRYGLKYDCPLCNDYLMIWSLPICDWDDRCPDIVEGYDVRCEGCF